MIQVKKLIVADLSRKGSGLNELSPVRSVLEIYSQKGDLLAKHDSLGNYSIEDLVDFGKFCMSNNCSSIEENFKQWKN